MPMANSEEETMVYKREKIKPSFLVSNQDMCKGNEM